MIGLGGAIGTGLFLGSGLAISKAGPATIIAYILCALIALVIAWSLGEMVVVHPTTGSFGALARHYLGDWAGFVVRWTYWAIQVIAVGGEVVAAGIYIRYWWRSIPLWIPVVVLAATILAINLATVKLFGTVEYWFAMIKIVALVAFILVGAAYIFVGLPGSHGAVGFGNLTSHGGFFPNGVQGLGLAFVFVIFSFIGTEVVSVTAAESSNPKRDIPRATRWMLGRLAIFYILAMVVVVVIVPWTVTAQGGSLTESPFVRLFAIAGVPAAATVMNFVVLTAALSSANTNIYLTTRMMHSLSVDRYAPRWVGRLSGSGAPRRAVVASAGGLVIAAALSVNQSSTAYTILFGLAVFGALVVWILILATHFVFRREREKRHAPRPPIRLWGAPVTTSICALALLGILVSTAFISGLTIAWKVGVPFFAALTVAFIVIRRARPATGEREPLPDTLSWEGSSATLAGSDTDLTVHAHGNDSRVAMHPPNEEGPWSS